MSIQWIEKKERARVVPDGSALSRGAKAIFVERRLPYALERKWSQILTNLGRDLAIMDVSGYKVAYRRLTVDEIFIRDILVGEEYFDNFYTPKETDTVVDIGGNIGCFALSAARIPGKAE